MEINNTDITIGFMKDWDAQLEFITAQLPYSDNKNLDSILIIKIDTDFKDLRYYLESNYYPVNEEGKNLNEDSKGISICSFSSEIESKFDTVFIIDLNSDIDGLINAKQDTFIRAMRIARKKLFLLSCDIPSLVIKNINIEGITIFGRHDDPETMGNYDDTPF